MSVETSNSSGGRYLTNGSPTDPVLVTAADGVSVLSFAREVQFFKGDGGPVIVTASPRVQRGIVEGQELALFGTDDTATVTLQNGNGLSLNGACVLKDGSSLYLIWRGDVWCEVGRNDI